jgi:hypothetical protein
MGNLRASSFFPWVHFAQPNRHNAPETQAAPTLEKTFQISAPIRANTQHPLISLDAADIFKINISERLAVVSYAPAPPQTVMKIVTTL